MDEKHISLEDIKLALKEHLGAALHSPDDLLERTKFIHDISRISLSAIKIYNQEISTIARDCEITKIRIEEELKNISKKQG